MKGRTRFYMAIAAMAILCAWTIKPTTDITKAEWLIGTWENKTMRGNIYESWVKTNDKVLTGKSYLKREKDTIVFENLQLIQEKEGLVYIPIVKNQNGGLPVRFTAKTISETQLVFENPKHDFPQVISYTKITPDSLVAEISGLRNGQPRKQTFPMKRIK